MDAVKTTLNMLGEEVTIEVVFGRYSNQNIAVFANHEDGPYGRVTINVDNKLTDGEIAVKTYSENEYWVPQLLEKLPEVFQDTGKRIRFLNNPLCELHVWRLLNFKDGS